MIGDLSLAAAVALGDLCDFAADHPQATDPEEGDSWGEDRTVRAEVLVECLQGRADWPVHRKGIRLNSARIIGSLDLAFGNVEIPLQLKNCAFDRPVVLKAAKMRSLDLTGSRLPELKASEIVIDGSLILRNTFTAKTGVDLNLAKIRGLVDCTGACISAAGSIALNLAAAEIGGYILLCHGFRSSLYCWKANFAQFQSKTRR